MQSISIVVLIIGLCDVSWAKEPCTVQNYADLGKEPRFDCPGPVENVLVPSVSFRPSVGVKAGKSIKPDYDSILMDKVKVVQLGLRIQALRKLRWVERHKDDKRWEIERSYLSDIHKAKAGLLQHQVDNWKDQAKRAREERDEARAWYRRFSTGLVAGIVVTAAATVAVAFTVK